MQAASDSSYAVNVFVLWSFVGRGVEGAGRRLRTFGGETTYIYYMILTDDWFTSVSHTEEGAIVLLTVRKGLTQFIESGKLRVRVDIAWPYTAEPDGMPDEETARLIEEIEPKLRRIMEKDKLAILTGNYTGGGQKDWIFYTRHLPSFGERLNECLAPYPTLPLEIQCQEDEDWSDYHEMLTLESDDTDED